MGRRYGRNQKRKHREQIVNQEVRIAKLVDDLKQLWTDRHRLRRELKVLLEAIEAVQPLSVLLPATLRPMMNVDRLQLLGYEELRYRPPEPLTLDLKAVGVCSLDTVRRYVYALSVEILSSPRALEHSIHLIARSSKARHGTAYFVEEETLKCAKDLPEVRSEICRRMLVALEDAQKEKKTEWS